jgi:hypothetical protein
MIVGVGVGVGSGVGDEVTSTVGVAVAVGVGVDVAVAVGDGDGVGVGLGATVAVAVGVGSGRLVGVGTAVGFLAATCAQAANVATPASANARPSPRSLTDLVILRLLTDRRSREYLLNLRKVSLLKCYERRREVASTEFRSLNGSITVIVV